MNGADDTRGARNFFAKVVRNMVRSGVGVTRRAFGFWCGSGWGVVGGVGVGGVLESGDAEDVEAPGFAGEAEGLDDEGAGAAPT